MFRPRDPQSSLLTSSMLLPGDKRERLERDWPGEFRRSVLPLIDEELFRDLYCHDNGCPNKPVQTIVGVLILKDIEDLTDMQALGALDFDLRWHVALDLEPEEAHLCQKTLHNFRARIMADDRARVLFVDMVGKILAALGIDTSSQRLDSTHVVSNIARLTRLRLFCETMRVFLKELKRTSKRKYRSVPEKLRTRYLKNDGEDSSYDDARSTEARRRLAVCARDTWRLVDRFRKDRVGSKLDSFALLKRLLDEQCEIVKKRQKPESDDADAREGAVPVVLNEAKKVASSSMQSPHDPDVTYNAHKGKGCEVQVAETTGNGDKPEIITYADVTRSCESDEKATVPVVDDLAEREIQPDELVADTNYGSTANAIELERRGTELVTPVAGPHVAEDADADDEDTKGADAQQIDKGAFDVDVKGERPARCPAGCDAIAETVEAGTGKARLTFAPGDCEACPLADRCPARRKKDGTRVLKTTLHDSVLARRRRHQQTEAFRERYAIRAGVEGTNSELKRKHGMGRLRVRGAKRVRLAVRLKALACNVKRMVGYLVDAPRAAARAEAVAAPAA
jgi:hypothetical protein